VYQVQSSGTVLRGHRRALSKKRDPGVSRTVILLGLTSMFTDISSEMVAAILPIYLVYSHGFSPLQFGAVDGLYQGASALVRVGSGFLADRRRRHKQVATLGYGLSAFCRPALLAVGGSLSAISAVLLVDRTGKGIRTAPRDAMISLSSPQDGLGTAFGVHRALDTTGAMLGPVIAFGLLAIAPLAFDSIFVVSFCFALIGLGIIVLLVDDTPREPVDPEAPVVSLRAALGLMGARDVRALVAVAAGLGVVTASDGLLYLALQRHVGIEPSFFPLMFVGTATAYMVLAVPAGRLADRVGRGRVFLAGYVLLAGAYAGLLAPPAGTPGLLVVLLVLGAYYAATDGVLMAMGSSVLTEDLRASGLALIATATSVGRMVAALLFGALWTAFGIEAALRCFMLGLVIVIAFAALALRRSGAFARA